MRILCPLRIYFHQDGLIWGLKQAGCEVRVLDGNPISQAQLARHINDFRPDLLLSYGWWLGHLRPEDLSRLRRRYGLPHVYWASDDPTHYGIISRPLAPLADLVFTTTEEMIPAYRAMGKKSAYLQFACNPEIHRRIEASGGAHHDIVLIGNNYSGFDFMCTTYRGRCMQTMISPLVDAGMDVKIYGGNWDNVRLPFHVPQGCAGPAVPYRRQAEYYSGAKIVLGLQTEYLSRTQTSCRPFEVLGCRAFHLAPATRSMKTLFAPGKHLAASNNPAETLALARYYLDHEKERNRIAAQGQLEVYTKHTYLHRAGEFLSVVKESL